MSTKGSILSFMTRQWKHFCCSPTKTSHIHAIAILALERNMRSYVTKTTNTQLARKINMTLDLICIYILRENEIHAAYPLFYFV